MILELPPAVEQMIVHNANQQGISPESYIMSLLPSRPPSFVEACGILAGHLDNALTHQQALRDEWDNAPC